MLFLLYFIFGGMALSWDFQSLPCTYMNAKDGEIGNKTEQEQ